MDARIRVGRHSYVFAISTSKIQSGVNSPKHMVPYVDDPGP